VGKERRADSLLSSVRPIRTADAFTDPRSRAEKAGLLAGSDGGEHFSKPASIVLSMTAPAERWKAASLSKSSSMKGGEICRLEAEPYKTVRETLWTPPSSPIG
jgi:hypothetical protein